MPSIDELATEICTLAGHINAANHRFLDRVSFRYDDDGSLIITCHLPAEVGAVVMKALDVAMESLPVYEDSRWNAETGDAVQRAACRRPRPHCREFPGARCTGVPGRRPPADPRAR